MTIPVVMQPCCDNSFDPIGVVAADSKLLDNFDGRFSSLVEALQAKAPPGTERLYGLRYRECKYHGYLYLRGTADAYGRPACKMIQESENP